MSLVVVGAGCVSSPVSNLTPEQASASLTLAVGSEIQLRPTVFGIGGRIVEWISGEAEDRVITIEEWVPGERVGLSWSVTKLIETVESQAAREAYETQYAQSPVGVEIPEAPEPAYEEQIVSGSIASDSMNDADTLFLPSQWPEGDGGVVSESLIWLSKATYDELVNTRSTSLSLGLFDESLMRVEEATSQLKSFIDKASDLIAPFIGGGEGETSDEEAVLEDELTMVKAESDWGEYTLYVDGVRTSVRVVNASNAFASYAILANPENPLMLEIQLTPLSRGQLDLLSASGLVEGFGGYEVTQINLGHDSEIE